MIETTCKYMLRCGWCDKRNIQCPQNDSVVFNTNSEISNAPHECQWDCVGVNTLGAHFRCRICGKTEFRKDE